MSTEMPGSPRRDGGHDRGGFAYGELHESEPAIQEAGKRGRDAPLSQRGRWVFGAIVALLVTVGVALLVAAILSR